jgi:homoserine O-acetyltransferase/O-succinyltransferase
LVNRFNAYTYYVLSRMMDSHNVGRGRGSNEQALATIKAQTLVAGIKSDILFPVSEQKYLAKHINNARLVEIDSTYGHDGFLIEAEKLTVCINEFYRTQTEALQIY